MNEMTYYNVTIQKEESHGREKTTTQPDDAHNYNTTQNAYVGNMSFLLLLSVICQKAGL